MKIKATTFLKQVVSVIVTIVKAKSEAVKSKTNAMKTRLLVFGLLRNKKVLMSAISHKIHALMGQEKEGGQDTQSAAEDISKAIVLYNEEKESEARSNAESAVLEEEDQEEDDVDDYPDLRHSLFDMDGDDDEEEDGLANGTGSVIDLVRNTREGGADFSLEDEIDHVADVFIRRFHKQMKMQKQQSFKRYQEMLARGV